MTQRVDERTHQDDRTIITAANAPPVPGLSLAGQLLERECAIHAGGADDRDAHAFIDNLSEEQRGDVQKSLRAMWALSTADIHPTDDASGSALNIAIKSNTLRESLIGIALLRNFNCAEAMKRATLAAERMGATDD